MKKRVRFGIRLKLPLGLFPHAATFVVHLPPDKAEMLRTKLEDIQALLILSGEAHLANRLFVEVS